MTFEERERKIFFDVISDLTGHYDQHGTIELGLTRRHIIKRVGEKITIKRATELFEEFIATGSKYLDDEKEDTYRISAAGRVLYFEHLKQEEEKTELDKKSVRSTIKTGLYTRTNIIIGVSIALVTLVFIFVNFLLGLRREYRESDKEKRELLQQIQQLQQSHTAPNQIYLHLSDTPHLKVKIEK